MTRLDDHDLEPDTPEARARHAREARAHAARLARLRGETTNDAGATGADEKEMSG